MAVGEITLGALGLGAAAKLAITGRASLFLDFGLVARAAVTQAPVTPDNRTISFPARITTLEL